MKAPALCLAAALILFSGHAEAGPWVIDYKKSKLGFAGRVGDTPFQGSFNSFEANVDFDPEHPEAGKITATVYIATASTENSERDGLLPQPDWFNTPKFPQATFTSTEITKTGENTYEAKGTLSLKGDAHPVTLPFTLTQKNGVWVAQGRTTLMRNTWHIGEGQWSRDETVRWAVDVTVDLVARPGV
ncbi:MAG: YceI family protein [Bdellovibrionales bacterium]